MRAPFLIALALALGDASGPPSGPDPRITLGISVNCPYGLAG